MDALQPNGLTRVGGGSGAEGDASRHLMPEPDQPFDQTTTAPPRRDGPTQGADQRSGPPGKPRPERPKDSEPPTNEKKSWFKRPLPMAIVIVIATSVVLGGALWWRHSRQYEKTDDAFVDVVAERVSPQVAGRVTRVLVNDNQDVAAGQALIEIDPADFRNRLQQAQAARAQAEAQVAQAEAQRTIREAEVEQARAAAGAAATGAANAASDYRRLQQARAGDEGAASAQQLDHAEADQRSTAAQANAARKAVAAAEAQLALVTRQIEAARAAVQSAKAQADEAQLEASYTQVKASVAGRIAGRTVTAGNYVSPGSDLMAIVPRDVYVTADFKETQLNRLRPGQPAEVKVDAYPKLRLRGHVDSVEPATGAAFTPIPAQNAAGNWVKVVQRVPVKIALDEVPADPGERIGPGMSVEVSVAVEPTAIAKENEQRQRRRDAAEGR